MEQLPLNWKELISIVVFFSSLTLLIGMALQFVMLYAQDRALSIKLFVALVVTQVAVLALTMLIWLKWPMGLQIKYGPILYPAAIAEVALVPLISSFFNYGLSFKRRRSSDEQI